MFNEAIRTSNRLPMNTETFGQTLFDLYQLSRHAPMPDFQRLALDTISNRFDFDSAWWGMSSQPPEGEMEVHVSLPYRLPSFYPGLWDEIKQEDTIVSAVMEKPGVCVNFGRKSLNASPGLASLMARFGITSCLCVVTLLPELNLMAFLSLYRVEGKPPFSETERRYTQLLMPHLTAALSSNWLLHLERVRANNATGSASLGVVDSRGMLYVADQNLISMMRVEWPEWQGPLLPDAMVKQLRAGAPYRGKRLSMRTHPVGDLWLIDLRLVTVGGHLSPRELEIAQMFSTGASYKEIARDLGIAPTTARHHLREIYRKLGVSDKAALAHKLLAQNDSEIVLDGHSHFEELPGALSAFGDVKPV